MFEFLLFILIGATAGWLAGIILKRKGFGLLLNLVIGIIGGFLGGWLVDVLGIPVLAPLGIIGKLIAAVVGAVILLWIVSLFKKK